MTSSVERLDSRIQKWIFKQGWESLRDIQEEAIEPILDGWTDVVISASTAAGKTEAAFLPALSAIANQEESFGVIYISPLKALINDQYRRLELLCEALDMPVTPWHGDISQTKKRKAKLDPQGVLLITPESLESLLIRDSGWARSAFSNLSYVIIDEYHAFLGTERGCHLQSLMHRIECLLDRESSPIPRIALSATLGDMDGVMEYLRPIKSLPCKLIQGAASGNSLKMQVRGYVDIPAHEEQDPDEYQILPTPADHQIADDLYKLLRGSSNLVFANSRQRTEDFAVKLSERCEENLVPNEFFPHHGSLSKELREDLESRLQKESLPTTAVCTMTLELGIDIGKVQSVAQVTAPHSVASLRQRLGRSGRRGESAILRMFIAENELSHKSNIIDKLRLELLQSIAMIRLLVGDKWYEPADTKQYHFSTLFHQILAVIAQWGGVRADQLWNLLCHAGPFNRVSVNQFKLLLSHMGQEGVITQMGSGEIVLSDKGERIVDHYTFYAVFKTPEEFRIVTGGKTLGTLPVDTILVQGQPIVFGGRRWKVLDIDADKKVIDVEPSKGGRPPKFGGGVLGVHDIVRREMFNIYCSGDYLISAGESKVEFLNPQARSLFFEGYENFKRLDLQNKWIIQQGKHTYILPWQGDKTSTTIAQILRMQGFEAGSFAGVIEIENAQAERVSDSLFDFINDELPNELELAINVENKLTEKYDDFLPEKLLCEGFAAKYFDLNLAVEWIGKRFKEQ